MVDNDATPEALWQRLVRENPRASELAIRRLFLAVLVDDENLRLQMLEQFFEDMKKRLRSLH